MQLSLLSVSSKSYYLSNGTHSEMATVIQVLFFFKIITAVYFILAIVLTWHISYLACKCENMTINIANGHLNIWFEFITEHVLVSTAIYGVLSNSWRLLRFTHTRPPLCQPQPSLNSTACVHCIVPCSAAKDERICTTQDESMSYRHALRENCST